MRSAFIAAIVAALISSAGTYAANKLLITSTSQISPSVRSALKGPRGPEGKQGEVGAAVGVPGPRGPQGSSTIGATGPRGVTGAEGPRGPKGEQGPQGEVSEAKVQKDAELVVEKMALEGRTGAHITIAEVEELKKGGLVK